MDTDDESTDELESSLSLLMLSPPIDITLDRDSGTEVPRIRGSEIPEGLLEGSGAEINLDMGSGFGVGTGILSS